MTLSVAPAAPTKLRDRGPLSKGLKKDAETSVDRENRVIYGYSVITRGEALGHYFWIDGTALDQTVAFGKAAAQKGRGIKCRFTHPDICNNALGKFLGRARNFRLDGDQVRADLYLADAASNAPDGDLATYVMTLAEEDPDAFATSIVFTHDNQSESEFKKEHTKWDDIKDTKIFKSPDPDNEKNLPHVRLASLNANDIVDEGAANEGLFGRESLNHLAASADRFLSFAFLGGNRPEESAFDIDPDQATTFIHRWLERKGLQISAKPETYQLTEKESAEIVRLAELAEAESQPPRGEEDHMKEEEKLAEAKLKAEKDAATLREEGQTSERERFALLNSEFPEHPEFVAEQFAAGNDIEVAKGEFKDVQLSELKAENEQLKAGVGTTVSAATKTEEGNAPPVEFGTPAAPGGTDFLSAGRAYSRENKVSLRVALRAVARENPALAKSYRDAARAS